MYISVKTASVHVSNILRKLDVPGRHDAARSRTGWVAAERLRRAGAAVRATASGI